MVLEKIIFSDNYLSLSELFSPQMFLPDDTASVFSSSWASFPIQTNTWKWESVMLICSFHCSDSAWSLCSGAESVKSLVSLPAPRCRGSWHHQWRGRLGLSPRVPPQSERKRGIEWSCVDVLCAPRTVERSVQVHVLSIQSFFPGESINCDIWGLSKVTGTLFLERQVISKY